jgi:catechol 2,3-dioxygenase-like lactoylglutathione lyase family enzyme
MPIDHVTATVSDFETGKSFYSAALKPLGYDLQNAFYEAAMAAGGKDNGAPGLREHYHENYYAAYVHDADGNNIEAVCHTPT